jgi:hypothetical protein
VSALRTLSEYRAALDTLLGDCAASMTDDEISALRATVAERRNARRDRVPTQPTPDVGRRADDILSLLQAAARDLRPRETQELDDLVAGRVRRDDPPASQPVRLRRNGLPRR